ncbi:MAG: ABC transporter ATP-binding protein [Ruminococcaceae bacterium]|nr:ABC transporter ATP-binding protein [Oscillospiraceae bacterium]
MSILSIKGLEKSFGDKRVLRGLDMEVPEHSVFGFVGRNGAGKTTAMKAVLGLLGCDKGEIFVMGERVRYGAAKTNRLIGYLPDVPEFYPFMTAAEYMYLSGECLGMTKREISLRTGELLSMVGLSEENHRIGGYSRGMKQRLGIAQALLPEPKLLICDEPTSALDPIGRREILEILQAVRAESTVIFSTHILSDVERICTDVAFLEGGVIASSGTVVELKARHASADATVLEVENSADVALFLKAYPMATVKDGNILRLCGGDVKTKDVIAFVAEKGIPVLRIEKEEPTLESVFLEEVSL